jgi:hypothetical protein
MFFRIFPSSIPFQNQITGEEVSIFGLMVKQCFHVVVVFLHPFVHLGPVLLDLNQLIYSSCDMVWLFFLILLDLHHRER